MAAFDGRRRDIQDPDLAEIRRLLDEAASERLRLRVVAAEHEGYGQYTWTGELLGDSQLWPGLKAGEQVTVDSYEVREWKTE